MSKEMQPFDVPKVTRDPLDEVKVGDWYWVKYEKDGDEPEHEHLCCVEEIGSNFVGFTRSSGRGSYGDNIHFREFIARCRPEPNWRDMLQDRMARIQGQIREKTKLLQKKGQDLYLLAKPKEEARAPEAHGSLLPVKVADAPNQYKKELVKLRDKTMPAITKEIGELAEEFSAVAKDMALPELVRLGAVKCALGKVEDRIFTIELYCGLQEQVVRIAEGESAPMEEKIAVRQAMLFMDEETLFDYEDGGMDFDKIGEFDEWVTKPENLSRVLPEPKGVVAFRVRRDPKEYGEARDLATAWAHMCWKEANEQTYLLIRNGGNVFRIASSIDFSPRLIPRRNEIGEEQFKKIHEKYDWDTHKSEYTEELITPDSVEFDEHVKKVDALLKQYNRVVILVQGLLDRSKVFHPHPPIRLTVPGELDEWVRLIRDEEDGLPSNRVTWEEYQKQLNSTLRKGKWVYVDSEYDEGYKGGEKPYRESSRYQEPRRRGWMANRMPDVCQVESMRKDGSAVRLSWPWGKTCTPRSKRWVESPDRPGWGHYERDYETDRMCHEWVPVGRVLNVSDYSLGDYKMFLCDRALRGKYLKWAKYVLTAEDWQRDRAKGIPPEKDKKAQVQR